MTDPKDIPTDWEPFPTGRYGKARIKAFLKWKMIEVRKVEGKFQWRKKR